MGLKHIPERYWMEIKLFYLDKKEIYEQSNPFACTWPIKTIVFTCNSDDIIRTNYNGWLHHMSYYTCKKDIRYFKTCHTIYKWITLEFVFLLFLNIFGSVSFHRVIWFWCCLKYSWSDYWVFHDLSNVRLLIYHYVMAPIDHFHKINMILISSNLLLVILDNW